MKIIKATDEEKKAYAETQPRPVAPLFGWVMMQGQRIAVEYLGEGKDEPNYEAIAPTGFHFTEEVHTLIGVTQRDLLDRLAGNGLESCTKECNYEPTEVNN